MSESKIQEPLWHFAGPGRGIKDHQNHQDHNHVRAGIEDHVQNHVRNQDQNRDPSHVQSGIRGHNRVHQSRGRIRQDHNLETDRARAPGIGARVVQDHGGKQLGIDD